MCDFRVRLGKYQIHATISHAARTPHRLVRCYRFRHSQSRAHYTRPLVHVARVLYNSIQYGEYPPTTYTTYTTTMPRSYLRKEKKAAHFR